MRSKRRVKFMDTVKSHDMTPNDLCDMTPYDLSMRAGRAFCFHPDDKRQASAKQQMSYEPLAASVLFGLG